MTGRPSPTRGEPTACATLVIIPGQLTTSRGIGDGLGQYSLLHRPSGWHVAAADEPAALHHLAQQLAWFDDRASDPRCLNDPTHADIAGSIEAILQQWLSLETDSRARSGINPLVSGLVSTPSAADLND